MRALQQLRSQERALMPSDSHGLNAGSITCPCGQLERNCLRQTGTLEQVQLLDCSVPHPIQLKNRVWKSTCRKQTSAVKPWRRKSSRSWSKAINIGRTLKPIISTLRGRAGRTRAGSRPAWVAQQDSLEKRQQNLSSDQFPSYTIILITCFSLAQKLRLKRVTRPGEKQNNRISALISQNPHSLLPKSPPPSLVPRFPYNADVIRRQTISSLLHHTQTAAMLTPTFRSSAESAH